MNKARLTRTLYKITFILLMLLCTWLCMPKIEDEQPVMIPEAKIEAVQLKAMTISKEPPTIQTEDLRAERSMTIPDLYTLEEREIIARVVHAEARGECFEGQIAVAQVVLNRLESGKFGETLNKITRRSQFAKSSTYNDENMRAVNQAIWSRPLPDNVLYFQKADRRTWGESTSIKKYCRIGKHTFYEALRLKGA